MDMEHTELIYLRTKLKQGEYDGSDIMKAWIAIDELIALKEELNTATQFRDRVCHLQLVNFGNATATHIKLHTLVNELT